MGRSSLENSALVGGSLTRSDLTCSTLSDEALNIPSSVFVCPITQTLMQTPKRASSGYIYEEQAILDWYQQHGTDFVTGQPCAKEQQQLQPVPMFAAALQEYHHLRADHPQHLPLLRSPSSQWADWVTTQQSEPPAYLLCPIALTPMIRAVRTQYGQMYDYQSLKQWVTTQREPRRDPNTNLQLTLPIVFDREIDRLLIRWNTAQGLTPRPWAASLSNHDWMNVNDSSSSDPFNHSPTFSFSSLSDDGFDAADIQHVTFNHVQFRRSSSRPGPIHLVEFDLHDWLASRSQIDTSGWLGQVICSTRYTDQLVLDFVVSQQGQIRYLTKDGQRILADPFQRETHPFSYASILQRDGLVMEDIFTQLVVEQGTWFVVPRWQESHLWFDIMWYNNHQELQSTSSIQLPWCEPRRLVDPFPGLLFQDQLSEQSLPDVWLVPDQEHRMQSIEVPGQFKCIRGDGLCMIQNSQGISFHRLTPNQELEPMGTSPFRDWPQGLQQNACFALGTCFLYAVDGQGCLYRSPLQWQSSQHCLGAWECCVRQPLGLSGLQPTDSHHVISHLAISPDERYMVWIGEKELSGGGVGICRLDQRFTPHTDASHLDQYTLMGAFPIDLDSLAVMGQMQDRIFFQPGPQDTTLLHVVHRGRALQLTLQS